MRPEQRITAWVLALILATAILRIGFGAMTGLGIDESYMVAAGREFRLGYFDHPPASWWLAAAAAKLVGSEAALVVRAPFIALFGLSTWLMYRLGSVLFSPMGGLWAAVALNMAPVFAVTTGTWVLPDGPLLAALLGGALCLARALDAEPDGGGAWRWWLSAGGCTGLALFAKYSAALSLAGAGFYMLTQPAHRHWLRRPQPYVAGIIALLIFAPVMAWNATHGWVSFAFQGGRTGAVRFVPLAPLLVLAGQALFIAPWVWLPLVISLYGAARRGVAESRSWLLVCLSLPAILVFTLVAAVSDRPVLYHWAMPGYLLVFPLLGERIAAHMRLAPRATRIWLAGGGIFICLGVGALAAQARWNMFNFAGVSSRADDPTMEMVDWSALLQELRARAGKGPAASTIAATNWRDAGKIDYALRGEATVICLCLDGRQYALNHPPADFIGQDVLLVMKQQRADRTIEGLRPSFGAMQVLAPVTLLHAGQPATVLSLIEGRALRGWPPQ